MPKRGAELRFVNPEQQAMVEERRRAMARHTSKGKPGLIGNSDMSIRRAQAEDNYREYDPGRMSPEDEKAIDPKVLSLIRNRAGSQMSGAEREVILRGPQDLMSEQPKPIDWGIIDPPDVDFLKRTETDERARLYNPSMLRSLSDREIEMLSERAKTNEEAEDTDLEMDARGYNEEMSPGATIPGRTWKTRTYRD